MAFTDPLPDVTLAGSAQALPRIRTDGAKSIYQKSDLTLTVTLSHRGKEERGRERVVSLAHFEQRSIVADPLTAANDYEFLRVSLQIDRPLAGFTATQVDQLVSALKGYLTTGNVTKIYGQET
jgi:glucan biosynthesis protein